MAGPSRPHGAAARLGAQGLFVECKCSRRQKNNVTAMRTWPAAGPPPPPDTPGRWHGPSSVTLTSAVAANTLPPPPTPAGPRRCPAASSHPATAP